MTLNMNLLLLVGIVAIFIQTANSHYCYSCNTVTGDGKDHCADSFDMEGIIRKDCSQLSLNSTGCMKVISKSRGFKTYTRNCYFGYVTDNKKCETLTGVKRIFGQDADCYICVNDLCNGSSEVTATMSFGLFLAIFLVRNLF